MAGNFLKVKCPKCKNEQVIFGKCSFNVTCLICKQILAKPTGKKAEIKCKIIEIFPMEKR